MTKTILITGSTDGIGLAAAKSLAKSGHTVLLHGRNENKLNKAIDVVSNVNELDSIDSFIADLSDLSEVKKLADEVLMKYPTLDVLINNAGIYKTSQPITKDGFDARFMVNTIAPYYLTQCLLPVIPGNGRVINLSSAAQAPVQPHELNQAGSISDSTAYAKSKLAITMWTRFMAQQSTAASPIFVAVNPASMLGSKMVQDAYGVAGGDIQIGADILVKASISDEFANASGKYFDNDIGRFTSPHPHALDDDNCMALSEKIAEIIANNVV